LTNILVLKTILMLLMTVTVVCAREILQFHHYCYLQLTVWIASVCCLVLHYSRIKFLLDLCVCFVILGEMLNVHDAYSHPNFFSGIDEMTGFKTR